LTAATGQGQRANSQQGAGAQRHFSFINHGTTSKLTMREQ
jgi:hypothetical protein